jgi:hypothetical protein
MCALCYEHRTDTTRDYGIQRLHVRISPGTLAWPADKGDLQICKGSNLKPS